MNTETETKVLTGEVSWFNGGKGYGFISRKDGEDDLFVHFSGLLQEGYRTLKQGQKVRFTVGTGPKGIQAENVEVIK
jgi:CspA family cold shock protein